VGLIPKALKDYSTDQTVQLRSLTLVLSTKETDRTEIIDALEKGQEELEMLSGVDGKVSRDDDESGELFTSTYSVTLTNRRDLDPTKMSRERFQLSMYDDRCATILDDFGVYGVPRIMYLNYARGLWRIKEEYSRENWSSKIQELKETEPFPQLNGDLLERYDSIFCPELAGGES
jgi:hypothetical protein